MVIISTVYNPKIHNRADGPQFHTGKMCNILTSAAGHQKCGVPSKHSLELCYGTANENE